MPGVTTAYQTGIHSARPSNGSGCVLYSCTTHSLVYRDDGTSWITFMTLGTAGALSDPMTTRGDTIVRNSSNTTARLAVGAAGKIFSSDGTDASWGNGPMTTAGDIIIGGASGLPTRLAAGATSGHVLTSNGSGAAPSYQAAGGGGSSRPYLDTLTLHATYGDDFTGALNTGLWTRRTVTSGEETTNVAGSNGWMNVDLSSGAASRLYLQTAPAGDFEIILSMAQHATASGHMVGPVIIDSTGAGVAAFFYNSAVAFYLGVMSGYAYSSFPTTLFVNGSDYVETTTTPTWIGLKKSGTSYSVRYSLNGYVWSPYSSTSTQTFTVDRIGFGRILGTPTTHRMSVDRFNVI